MKNPVTDEAVFLYMTVPMSLTVLNYLSVQNFCEDTLVLMLEQGQMLICGEHLELGYFGDGEIRIRGEIRQIQFKKFSHGEV